MKYQMLEVTKEVLRDFQLSHDDLPQGTDFLRLYKDGTLYAVRGFTSPSGDSAIFTIVLGGQPFPYEPETYPVREE